MSGHGDVQHLGGPHPPGKKEGTTLSRNRLQLVHLFYFFSTVPAGSPASSSARLLLSAPPWRFQSACLNATTSNPAGSGLGDGIAATTTSISITVAAAAAATYFTIQVNSDDPVRPLQEKIESVTGHRAG